MKTTIISHDKEKAVATIKFEHNDVTFEDTFDLKMIIPGSAHILNEMGIDFTEDHQTKVIEKLTAKVQSNIESGIITNAPPPPPVDEYVAPPPPPPPTVTEEETITEPEVVEEVPVSTTSKSKKKTS